MARKSKMPAGMWQRGQVYYARFSSQGRLVRKRLSTDFATAKLLLNELMARSDRGDFGYSLGTLKRVTHVPILDRAQFVEVPPAGRHARSAVPGPPARRGGAGYYHAADRALGVAHRQEQP